MPIWNIWSMIRAARVNRSAKRRQNNIHSSFAIDRVESLEDRVVLYAATGSAWPTPDVVTISFMPDGTNLGGVKSNLNSAFNGNSAIASKWKTEILRAAQTWAQATNINFVLIEDNGVASGGGNYQQGDPAMGDIRIGGYNFGNASLARAYAPPPANNYSIAGDITFNTGISFGVGTGYDLFTVAVHEIGHALGLDHTSTSSASEMWSTYNGVKPSLSDDDLAGIRNIYSANDVRSQDAYDDAASNATFATASSITSILDAKSKEGVVNNLDITSTSDVDFFKFVAPAGSKGTIKITVQSTGLSQLSPNLTVYAADQKTVLGSASGLNKFGATLTVKAAGIDDGSTYYIKVQGADQTAFSTGAYALIVNCGGTSDPEATIPSTSRAKGTTLTSSGGVAEGKGAKDDFFSTATVITNVSPDSGGSFSDRVTNTRSFSLSGAAPLAYNIDLFQDGVLVGSSKATSIILGTLLDLDLSLNKWTITPPKVLADGVYTFVARATDLLGLVKGYSDAFTVRVDTQAPNAPAITIVVPVDGKLVDGVTSAAQLTLSGTAERNSSVTVYANGTSIGRTMTDGQGNWSFSTTSALANRSHTFTARATDLAGNQSGASSPLTLTVDTIPPATPTISSATVQQQGGGAAAWVIGGSAAQAANVEIYLNGIFVAVAAVSQNGTWTYQYAPASPITKGTYRFTARAKDAIDNASSLSAEFTKTI